MSERTPKSTFKNSDEHRIEGRERRETENEMADGVVHSADTSVSKPQENGEGQRSLAGRSPWGHRESGATEQRNSNSTGSGRDLPGHRRREPSAVTPPQPTGEKAQRGQCPQTAGTWTREPRGMWTPRNKWAVDVGATQPEVGTCGGGSSATTDVQGKAATQQGQASMSPGAVRHHPGATSHRQGQGCPVRTPSSMPGIGVQLSTERRARPS